MLVHKHKIYYFETVKNAVYRCRYLDEADQEIVQEIMDRDQISPSLSQAQKLHRLAQIDKIDDSAIETVIVIGNVDYYMRLSNIRITRVEGSIYLER